MAIEYDLEIVTKLEAGQMLRIMADALGQELTDRDLNGWNKGVSMRVDGLLITVARYYEQNLNQTLTEEYYGFRPDVHVGFRLLKDEEADYDAAIRSILQLTMAVLQSEPGDAVMLFNGEISVLQRISGALLIDASWKSWASHIQLSEVTLPYELRHLRSPAMEEHTPTVA